MSKAGDEEERDRRRTRHIDEHLGARVRFIRENHGLTQADMARKLDISTNQWGRHESGANRLPAARLWQFCEALKIDIASVFRGQPFSGAAPTAAFERPPEPQSLFSAHDAGGGGRGAAGTWRPGAEDRRCGERPAGSAPAHGLGGHSRLEGRGRPLAGSGGKDTRIARIVVTPLAIRRISRQLSSGVDFSENA